MADGMSQLSFELGVHFFVSFNFEPLIPVRDYF
jgi:hypothetical protein